ncbi:hypothetical protein MesoLj113a_73450 [Mesorhizobium sp. 113-1-2]|nr:hypothetical protein MesoLj113a_73450 [Mesorhizobium sp. 113-1-2]
MRGDIATSFGGTARMMLREDGADHPINGDARGLRIPTMARMYSDLMPRSVPI